MNALQKKLEGTKLILGSASPRRQLLLKEFEVPFEVLPSNADETFPDSFRREDIAMFVARKKASALKQHLTAENIITFFFSQFFTIFDGIFSTLLGSSIGFFEFTTDLLNAV